MNTEKKDPRFETDPKDFEVDLSQFEPLGAQDAGTTENRMKNSDAKADAGASASPRGISRTDGPPKDNAPFETTRPDDSAEPRKDKQTAWSLFNGRDPKRSRALRENKSPETQNARISHAADSSEATDEEKEKKARIRKRNRSLAVVWFLLLGAAFFMGYLNAAGEEDNASTYAPILFFVFSVAWLLFIVVNRNSGKK